MDPQPVLRQASRRKALSGASGESLKRRSVLLRTSRASSGQRSRAKARSSRRAEGPGRLDRSRASRTASQAASLAKKSGVEQLILTHFSARYANLNDFYEEASKIFPNTKIAEDFKVFPLVRKGGG